ncbi:MAG TPA: hypothetical protein PKV75_04835 [Desulfobacterales bacterium]|nr:hypothetical protein [Desulfobacterales bacterium]
MTGTRKIHCTAAKLVAAADPDLLKSAKRLVNQSSGKNSSKIGGSAQIMLPEFALPLHIPLTPIDCFMRKR